jgi:gliding motility-associated-like protein
LNAGAGFDFYTWNGVPGQQKMAVYGGGIYKVEVGYGANPDCNSEDQVTIDYYELPEASITSGDYLCAGDTMWLRAPVGNYTYYWNNVQEDNTVHIIETGGLYTLKMENICGADSTEKNIEARDLPPVDLGEDVLLFPEESVTLDAGVYDEYMWNDDESLNDQFLTITSSDIDGADSVYVWVFDGYCYNKDGIIVEVFDVKVPAVITPNNDGENDLFMPFDDGWSGIHEHEISVFNRWGEKVWESTDFESGWDAKHNGTLVGDGTYYWVLEVKYGPQNLSKTYKGTLSVLGTGK